MVDLELRARRRRAGRESRTRVLASGLADEALLKQLIESHGRYTGSARAKEILENWGHFRGRFVKVFPKEYRRALAELAGKLKRIAA